MQTPGKAKKSLVDKITRTLDKLATVRREGGREERHRAPRPASGPGMVYPVYPGYHPSYRTVRGANGATYQYLYGGGGGAWPEQANPYQDYATPSPPPGAWCHCPDQGKDSVRRGTRCKACGKARSPYAVRAPQGRTRTRLPHSSPEGAPVVRSASSAAWEGRPRSTSGAPQGPRDPYDYIRRTRLKADDWDNYWETGSRETSSPGREGARHTRPGRLSTPPSRVKTSSPRPEDKGRRSGVPEMEDEDSSPESKPLVSHAAKERSPTPVKTPSPPLQPSPPPDSPAPQDLDDPESSSLLADLASMKSKMSVAEMRYRKFQRRNPLRKLSLQIDDVIMEEDEDALEQEDREEPENTSGSDDELGLGKFTKVLGPTNLAEEILSEIYGDRVNGGHGEGGKLSLAEEILEELYGSTTANTTVEEEEEEGGRYCSIEEVLEEEEEEESLEDLGENND